MESINNQINESDSAINTDNSINAINNFLEDEKYIRILHSKNYHIDYKYVDLKISPIMHNNSIVSLYEDQLYNIYRNIRNNLSVQIGNKLNIYDNINYFCGLYKILDYLKQKKISKIKNVNMYDFVAINPATNVNYRQYRDKDLFSILEQKFSVSYTYNMVYGANVQLTEFVKSMKNTLYCFIFVSVQTKNINQTLLNIINFMNNVDKSCSILLIGVYAHTIFLDAINFLSKHFKHTRLYSMKYFIGRIMYVVFSNRVSNIPPEKLKQVNTALSKNVDRLYNSDKHIEKHKSIIEKAISDYKEKINILIHILNLKLEDDPRYDAILDNINKYKENILDEFLNKK